MLFAIDTNPLLDWALGSDDIPDCFALIRRRIQGVSIIVPPTVLHELGHFAGSPSSRMSSPAIKSLRLIATETMLRPINLVPVGHGIVGVNAWKLRQRGLIDKDEINDSMVLAEAGLLGCEVLLSSDQHLTGIDPQALHSVMREFDGSVPLILSPRQVLRKFGRR